MREAIKVLAAEGLVTMKLRRGAYVTEMNRRDVIEAYELLALLESDATARVAASATESQLEELTAIHQQLEASGQDHEAFFNANERFHWRILEIENNRWRQQMVLELRRVMKLNRHHSLFKAGGWTNPCRSTAPSCKPCWRVTRPAAAPWWRSTSPTAWPAPRPEASKRRAALRERARESAAFRPTSRPPHP